MIDRPRRINAKEVPAEKLNKELTLVTDALDKI